MITRSRFEHSARRALWLGGVLVVVGSLFGMHGLDNHGSASTNTVAHTSVLGSAVHAAAAGHRVLSDTVRGAGAAVVVSDPPEHPGMDMGAAGMCVAVLVLALLTALLRIRGSGQKAVLWRVAPPARAPGVRGRDPDPPSLIELSIQRC